MLTGDRRELVEHGRLAEELEPPSFDDALAVLTAAGPPSTGSKSGRRRDSRNDASARRALDEARQRVRDLRTTKQKAGEAARATVARAAQAESEAARLRDESERAATEHAQTRKALAAAEQKLERLERTTARHRD
jgi:chromosome segregation ATPase